MHIKIVLLVATIFASSIDAQAQIKKKIDYYELDVIKGLFFQPNTVDPYTGLAFLDYPNGDKQMEAPIKNGKIDGKVKEWERNGKKVYEAEFADGVQIGKEEQWYSDGFNKLLVNYQNGKANGMCTEWHQTGGKKSLGEFVNGEENGEHNWWYATGTKDQTVNYKYGKEDGPMKAWHENGAIKLEAHYVEGKLEGQYLLWYSNGQKKADKTYKDSIQIGEAQYWATDGRLVGRDVFSPTGVLQESYNYNSGSIKVKNDHYVQVVNTQNAHYQISLQADDRIYFVDKAQDITYSLDGMLLQIFQYPTPTDVDAANPQAVFDAFLAKEKKFIEENTETEIEISQEAKVSKGGESYYYWHFASPSSKDAEQKARTVQSEHYITFICNDQILSLYSVVTNSDEPASVLKMLTTIAESYKCMNEPIDLNAIKTDYR